MLSNYEELENIIRSSCFHSNLKLYKPKVETILRTEFFTRFTEIQSWFMRCSFVNKLKFINNMFEIITKRDTLPIWCNIIQQNKFDKLSAYSETLKHHQFNYDKIFLDTNRTLDLKTLKNTMKNDLEWFQNFDEDLQEEIFLALLCMGGGGLIKSFSKNSIQVTVHTRAPTKSILQDTSEFDNSEPFSVRDFVNTDKPYSEELDPESELDLIVINKRKEWSNMIAKYSVAVKGKDKTKSKKKDKDKKSKKKKDKKSSKSKSTKTSKTSKSGKKSKATEIDYIQLLPIHIVKKIFSHLDKKTLKKAKTVNPYWEYAISSMAKDVKARKMLDKTIKKLKAILPENYEPPQRLCCIPEKRDIINLNEISASKKIQKQLRLKETAQDESIMLKAINDMADSYLIPTAGKLKTFPRKLKVDNANEYKGFPFIVFEGGFLEKRTSQLLPISEEINISNKVSKIETFSPAISSIDVSQASLYAPPIDQHSYGFVRVSEDFKN